VRKQLKNRGSVLGRGTFFGGGGIYRRGSSADREGSMGKGLRGGGNKEDTCVQSIKEGSISQGDAGWEAEVG